MDLACWAKGPRGEGVAPTEEGVAVNSPILELREESKLPLGLTEQRIILIVNQSQIPRITRLFSIIG